MKEAENLSLLRSLPQINEMLVCLEWQGLQDNYPRPLVLACLRKAVAETRSDILDGKLTVVDTKTIAQRASQLLEGFDRASLRRVINASGIIIHTNLGRSVLADEALLALQEIAGSYSTLEYDTDAMTRGSRQSHYEELLCLLTGAEAALAVNNNAAAVMMVLREFGEGREVIVSRGELVEIGGSFRIPDIMRLSHAQMIEVGTTNKTHPADYQNALSRETSLLLKVHQSNFKVVGFTQAVSVSELRTLADSEMTLRSEVASTDSDESASGAEVLVYEDQGSGVLIGLDTLTTGESTVSDSLDAGADLVSFSGDKLLGGPQAGIIVGKKRHIDSLKRSPLARALRLDKLSLAALEATLRLYLDEEKARESVPTLRMLLMPPEEVNQRARHLCSQLNEALASLAPSTRLAEVIVVEESAEAGGGSLPASEIVSSAVCIEFLQGSALACESFLVTEWATPIVGRIKRDCLLFDPRTLVSTDEMEEIALAVKAFFATIDTASAK